MHQLKRKIEVRLHMNVLPLFLSGVGSCRKWRNVRLGDGHLSIRNCWMKIVHPHMSTWKICINQHERKIEYVGILHFAMRRENGLR